MGEIIRHFSFPIIADASSVRDRAIANGDVVEAAVVAEGDGAALVDAVHYGGSASHHESHSLRDPPPVTP